MAAQDRARNARIEAWLDSGGTVLAATERAARSLVSAYHAARLREGRTAWLTPVIFPWESWVRDRWLERNSAGLMLLNPLQEQALWAQVIGKSLAREGLLHPLRLATAAQQAYRLLCGYSPNSLKAPARAGWLGDAATFSEWMEEFDSRCRRDGLISSSRLPLELADSYKREPMPITGSPLLLIGFDRLLETQESLMNAWSKWQHDEPGEVAQSAQFLAAPDAATEIQACVCWLRAKLAANPDARLLVITTTLQEHRGELERALLDTPRPNDPNLDFEFSLGVPLAQVSLARGAILLLRWLHEPLTEPELDWLLSSGHCAASTEEEIALAETMRELRRCGQEQPEWRLEDFAIAEEPDNLVSTRQINHASAWTARLLAARDRLREIPVRQSPLEWVSLAAELLETAGWPGFRPLSSTSFQARERWEQLLEECGSLGFNNSQMEWAEFVSTIAEAVSSTIFAAESSDAQIQITEPLESAGQFADGIWFLGAHEENWPGRGQPHPLLPVALQRESGMPHASPQTDWDLAQIATHRLLASADEVVFSYARLSAETEARPSRMVTRLVGHPTDLPQEIAHSEAGSQTDLTETFEDASLIPFPHTEIGGGAATLTRQSLCPFQAFATARLNAEDWEPAEAGLNPRQRGQLLHSVLHRVWSGPKQGGISSLEDLQRIAELRSFAGKIVASVMTESFDPARRNSIPRRFPSRYLELEAERLTQLVSEWLEYERERLSFTVTETEARREVTIAGLKLKLRLDRIDKLQNGQSLIVDYKSSEVGPSAWKCDRPDDRPDDIQLPLYATFAVADDLEGLVFARVRPGQAKFYGRVRDALSSLQPGLNNRNALVKDPLTDRQLEDWRSRIERLGKDFLAGRAEVNPKDPAKTCESCHLHAVCRIYENQPLAALADEGEDRDEDEESEGGLNA